LRKSSVSAVVTAISVLGLSACSSLNPSTPAIDPAPLLQDHYFPAANFELESPETLFELPDAMKRQLELQVLPEEAEYARYAALREWALRHFEEYEYTSLETVSLSQLNNTRKINCLSFSALFVAAARYVDIQAEYQLVSAPPYWDSNNGIWINNQHINLTGEIQLPPPQFRVEHGFDLQTIPLRYAGRIPRNLFQYTADLNPAIVSMRVKHEIVSEQEVTSLFYSNKAIESLVQDKLGNAYAYTRAALMAFPQSALAWNNLGVLYGRIEQADLAIAAYETAISLDDDAQSAKSNLARMYRNTGEEELALAMEQEVASYQDRNPYYHASLAEQAMASGDLDQALSLYQEALERKHNEQHFYHQLAIIFQALGDDEEVMANLREARRYARGEDRARFAGKLRALEELL